MGLFGRQAREQRNILDNPAIPLTSAGIISVLGTGLSSNAGVPVSEASAMRMAAVWRCVSLISGTIAQLPLIRYRTAEGADRQIVDGGLLDNPHPDLTRFEFWEMLLAHLLLWGNAFVLKVPNGLGQIVRLLPIPPWNVTVARQKSSNGSPYGPKTYTVTNGGVPLLTDAPYLTDNEIMHIPGLGYDGTRGLAPIAYARETIGLSLAAEEFGARLFGSGSLIGGVLQTDQRVDDEKATAIKLRWREKITGLARAHEVAVLDSGLKFTPIGLSPNDSQFLQSRQFGVNEICRFFGVPPHLVADVEKSTSWGTGIGEQSLGFVRYTLQHWMTRCEQRVTKHLCLPGEHAEFTAEGILRGDTAARYSAWGVALASGWMNRNEVRRKENMPQGGPELDEFPPTPAAPSAIAPPLPMGGKEPNGA